MEYLLNEEGCNVRLLVVLINIFKIEILYFFVEIVMFCSGLKGFCMICGRIVLGKIFGFKF